MLSNIKKRIFRKSKKLIGETRTRNLQHLPARTLSKLKRPPFCKISNGCVIEGVGLFISGSVVDVDNSVLGMELLVDNKPALSIDEFCQPVPRADLIKKYGLAESVKSPGFVALVKDKALAASKPRKIRIRLKLRNGKTRIISGKTSSAESNSLEAVKKILNAVPSNIPEKRVLFDNVYGPAISSIWSLRSSAVGGHEKVVYNEALCTSKPRVTLVIPIYGRYDFIEFQLSQFVNDPDMFEHEILYVIDDPRIHSEVKSVCSAYEKIYKIGFKVLYLEKNRGFAGANNIGVQNASAPLLLLINSDVMPSSAGWLGRLVDSAGEEISSMMLGVRLLYEDESIQHDGMKFHASPFVNNLWTNIHPNKGLPSSLVPANGQLRPVEAVTGACILMSKSVYETLGGFDESFILGDYEDSDLCMKARESGIDIKMNSDIHLYHLERQSQSLVTTDRWKNELTYYNCWYHTQKWDTSIKNMNGAVVNA